jgi:hypothetical protein
VRYNVLATSSEVAVAPQLERLLARITPHCRLETLILGVETECIINPPRWTPFPQFAELMDAPQFAAVSEIQFVVNGSPFCLGGSARRAREHFESLPPATLPSRPARRVVFIDWKTLIKCTARRGKCKRQRACTKNIVQCLKRVMVRPPQTYHIQQIEF